MVKINKINFKWTITYITWISRRRISNQLRPPYQSTTTQVFIAFSKTTCKPIPSPFPNALNRSLTPIVKLDRCKCP